MSSLRAWGMATLAATLCLMQTAPAQATQGLVVGRVSHVADFRTVRVDVMEATDIGWVNQQIEVTIKGISANRLSDQTGTMVHIGGFLQGKVVEMRQCTDRGGKFSCEVWVPYAGRMEGTLSAAEYLVAKGYATLNR